MKRLSIFLGFVLVLSIVSTGSAAGKRAGHPAYKSELSGQTEVPSVTTKATGEAVFKLMPAGTAGKGAGGAGETGVAGAGGGAAKSGPDNNFYSGILDKGKSTVEASGAGAGGAEKKQPVADIYYSGILDKGKSSAEAASAGAGGTEKNQPEAGIYYSGIQDKGKSLAEATGSGAGGAAGDVLHYKLSVKDIENVTAAHLHMGKKDTASAEAPVIAPLYTGPEKTGQFSGTLAEGTLSAKDLKGPMSGKSIHDLATMMNKGEVFVNVHTSQNPGGEIRGEVRPQ